MWPQISAGKPNNVTMPARDLIPIADEVFWGVIPRKGLRYLTRNPVCTENLNTGVAVMKSAQDGA